MDYQPLKIKDSERSTRGGPPGWLAFAIIIGAVVLITAISFAVSLVI